MGDELKPCPFCGVGYTDISNRYTDHYQVHCMTCGADGPSGRRLEVATTAWNTRTETQSQATIDELVGALNDAADDFSAIKEAVDADDGRLCWRTANFALDHIDTILSRHEGGQS